MTWKYRKQGNRITIEQDRKYKIQLPVDAEETYNALLLLRQSKKDPNASKVNGENSKNNNEKCAQSLLPEQDKTDAEPTEEEILKSLNELK